MMAGTYKIPTANDIPVDLRVTLLKDAPNPRTPLVHSSKAVGEPPLFLGAAVFFALKVGCVIANITALHSVLSWTSNVPDASTYSTVRPAFVIYQQSPMSFGTFLERPLSSCACEYPGARRELVLNGVAQLCSGSRVFREGGRGSQGLVRAGLAGDAGAPAHGVRRSPHGAIRAADFPA